MTPKRIQRQRTKGWRMPEGAVYVGRPTDWGNPWRVGEVIGGQRLDAEAVVTLYRGLYRLHRDQMPDPAALRGRDLACWCPLDQPCHADVLLALANPQDVFFDVTHRCIDGRFRDLQWVEEDQPIPPRKWLACSRCGYEICLKIRRRPKVMEGVA